MKKVFVLLLCAMLCCAWGAALAEETVIAVQGSASLTADPDIVVIMAGVSARKNTVGEAQQAINAVTRATVDALLRFLGK